MAARIFDDLDALPEMAKRYVVAIGNFDGVHLGHKKLLAAARRQANELGRPAGVMTFDPHPRRFFSGGREPFELSSLDMKAEYLEREGIDFIFVARFDNAFASLSPEHFVQSVLVKQLAASHVVVGENYRFGRERRGDVRLLAQLGETAGFGVTPVCSLKDEEGSVYSSTRVRAALKEGRPDMAHEILGRPWEVTGYPDRSVPGAVSLSLGGKLRPAPGLYHVRVVPEGVCPSASQHLCETVGWVPKPEDGGDAAFHIACDLGAFRNRQIRVLLLSPVGQGYPAIEAEVELSKIAT